MYVHISLLALCHHSCPIFSVSFQFHWSTTTVHVLHCVRFVLITITHLILLHCDFQYSSVHGTETTHCILIFSKTQSIDVYMQSMYTFCPDLLRPLARLWQWFPCAPSCKSSSLGTISLYLVLKSRYSSYEVWLPSWNRETFLLGDGAYWLIL